MRQRRRSGGRGERGRVRIAAVSDVTLGYGSPQIPALVRSLRERYRCEDAVIVEPDEPDRRSDARRLPDLRVIRVYTSEHPHSAAGRVEYILEATRELDKLRPDLLVVATTFCAPILFLLKRRPAAVLYYQLEPVEPYGPLDVKLNHEIGPFVDLMIYPEENRAAFDIEQFGDRGRPFAVLYNCSPSSEQAPLPAEDRNGRFIYHGTIEEGRTYAEYFLDERMRDVPLDLYGRVGGPQAAATQRKLVRAQGHLRYLGSVDAQTLATRRRSYAYSIVAWNPIDRYHLAACPNKFFESIAAGVPPIVAPHPQCKMLVERYECGIVMDGWDIDAFLRAIKQARSVFGTAAYSRMVANCTVAANRELNWRRQFAKLLPNLDTIIPPPPVVLGDQSVRMMN
jgi:glycosyltransferase involved in cell wall biosynthesis